MVSLMLTLVSDNPRFKYKEYSKVRCRKFKLSWDTAATGRLLEIPFKGRIEGTDEIQNLLARKWSFRNVSNPHYYKTHTLYCEQAERALGEIAFPLQWRIVGKLGSVIIRKR